PGSSSSSRRPPAALPDAEAARRRTGGEGRGGGGKGRGRRGRRQDSLSPASPPLPPPGVTAMTISGPATDFQRATRDSYDALAPAYVEFARGELAAKPLERALLGTFAELAAASGGGLP